MYQYLVIQVTGTLYINAMVLNDISEPATTPDEVAMITNSPMTTDEATRTDITDSMPPLNSPSSAAGPTAAAVVVVLLVLAGLIATLIMIIIVWRYKKKRNRPTSSYTVSTHPRQGVALGIGEFCKIESLYSPCRVKENIVINFNKYCLVTI